MGRASAAIASLIATLLPVGPSTRVIIIGLTAILIAVRAI